MGKGGYTGGSTLIGPGSSWFGRSRGKPIGGKVSLSSSKPVSAPTKKSKRRQLVAISTSEQARNAGLTLAEWRSKADQKVAQIEREITTVTQQLNRLQSKLAEAIREHELALSAEPITASRKAALERNGRRRGKS